MGLEKNDSPSDGELIAALNRGEQAAFETLYYRHRDWVVAVAYRFTGDREDALEVLQETFLYFLKKFPGFQLTAGLTTFLYPAVKHLALRAREKRGRLVSDEEALANVLAPEKAFAGSVEDDLAAVLRVLPPGHREVLLLRFTDDLNLEEIAAALKIPLGTVKSRLHNALKILRNDDRIRRYFLGSSGT